MSIISPSHYESQGIQPIEYINANKLDFCEGNVIKYVTRYKQKDGLKDLLKARQYIDFLIINYNGDSDDLEPEWVNPLKPPNPELRGCGGPSSTGKESFLKWLLG